MGCFFQCFGLSKKRKRRKTLYRVLAAAADQKHGNYQTLDSSLTVNLAVKENAIVPFSDIRDECKEKTSVKSKKKKVSFNLNVQIYQPHPNAYKILDSDDDEEDGEKENGYESATSTMQYPSNHRYYNCKDGYDEEEEESHLFYDDDDDDDWDDGNAEDDEIEIGDQNTRRKEICDKSCSSMAEDRSQDRSQYMDSVLRPVENLTQWKAMKAKVAAKSKHKRKENVSSEQKTSTHLLSEPYSNLSPFSLESKPLLPEIAVNASFSNWLISPAAAIQCQ
ncbi:hypothetical protein L6164_012960 [Bauhinia variegata]|uniref:Uncharacterized protein n=1 Tax=Bauhinia variegata TaxID=167791 RepID=A0ACB9PCW5_BAUVA|nr:hypothetical protein L6164_012960 [Bauhinia variegata]